MITKLPVRLYRCPECGYSPKIRCVLRNHLRQVHDYNDQDSLRVATESEYWLNPHYNRSQYKKEE